MNPFLEPTVAQPDPAIGQRKPTRRAWRLGSESGKARTGAAHAARPGVPRRRAAGTPNAASQALRAVVLMLSLLLPGLAMAVDVNTASAQQLQEIKGIGPKTASIIVEERERGGRFESIGDVSERVKGIGPKKAASLQAAGLKVGAEVAAADSGGRTAGNARRSR